MLTLSGATLIVARRSLSLPRIIFDVWSPWLGVRYVKTFTEPPHPLHGSFTTEK